jgi:hypothetical protein
VVGGSYPLLAAGEGSLASEVGLGTSTGPFLRGSTHLTTFLRIARFGFLVTATSEERSSAKSWRNIQHENLENAVGDE